MGLDVASAGILLLVLAMFVATLALDALDLDSRYFIRVEPPPTGDRITRYILSVRQGVIPLLDLSFALAILGILAIAAGTIQSIRRSRPASLVFGALGMGMCSVAIVHGFGLVAGLRLFTRLCGQEVLDMSCMVDEERSVAAAWSEAISGLWFFLIVCALAIAVLAASYALGAAPRKRVTSSHAS